MVIQVHRMCVLLVFFISIFDTKAMQLDRPHYPLRKPKSIVEAKREILDAWKEFVTKYTQQSHEIMHREKLHLIERPFLVMDDQLVLDEMALNETDRSMFARIIACTAALCSKHEEVITDLARRQRPCREKAYSEYTHLNKTTDDFFHRIEKYLHLFQYNLLKNYLFPACAAMTHSLFVQAFLLTAQAGDLVEVEHEIVAVKEDLNDYFDLPISRLISQLHNAVSLVRYYNARIRQWINDGHQENEHQELLVTIKYILLELDNDLSTPIVATRKNSYLCCQRKVLYEELELLRQLVKPPVFLENDDRLLQLMDLCSVPVLFQQASSLYLPNEEQGRMSFGIENRNEEACDQQCDIRKIFLSRQDIQNRFIIDQNDRLKHWVHQAVSTQSIRHFDTHDSGPKSFLGYVHVALADIIGLYHAVKKDEAEIDTQYDMVVACSDTIKQPFNAQVDLLRKLACFLSTRDDSSTSSEEEEVGTVPSPVLEVIAQIVQENAQLAHSLSCISCGNKISGSLRLPMLYAFNTLYKGLSGLLLYYLDNHSTDCSRTCMEGPLAQVQRELSQDLFTLGQLDYLLRTPGPANNA